MGGKGWKKVDLVVLYSRGEERVVLKFGENKCKAEWVWYTNEVRSAVIKFERDQVRSISNSSKDRKIIERVTADQQCRKL